MKLSELNIFERLRKLEERESELDRQRSELLILISEYANSRIDLVDRRITETMEDINAAKSIVTKPVSDLDLKADLDVK